MKRVFALAWVLCAVTPVSVRAEEVKSENNRFHLLSMKCQPEETVEAEATPQSPPLNVDDPSTPGCNRWEVNFVTDGDLARSQNTWEVPLLDVNYGVGDNVQLKYEVPYVATSGDSGSSAIGESKVGVKQMFFEDEASKTQFAVYPQVSFIGSNADAVRKGLATPGSVVTLPLLFTTNIGGGHREIDLTANVGYNLSFKDDETDFVSAAVALGTPISSRISVMGELSTEQAVANDSDGVRQSRLITNLGMMGVLSKSFMLFGSVGHSLYSSDQEGHSYVLTGARVLFGGV